MKFTIYLNAICTKAGAVKTVTSKKNGKQYQFREYDFIINNDDNGYDEDEDNEVSEIKGYAIFADEDGHIRELKEGNAYTLKFKRSYDRFTRSEREFIDVL